jgi:ATP-dependent helicase HepA
VVDTRRAERESYAPDARSVVKARDRGVDLSKSRKVLSTLVPPMLAAAEAFAETRSKREVERALDEARRVIGGEIDRLETLAKVNPAVRPEEIANVRKELAAIEGLLPESRARLDAVRFVASADFLAIRA